MNGKMLRRIGTLTLCLGLICAMNVFAGGGSQGSGSGSGVKTFTFGRSEDIQNFDPFNQNNIVNTVTNYLIYNFLVEQKSVTEFVPELATSWTVSPDNLT